MAKKHKTSGKKASDHKREDGVKKKLNLKTIMRPRGMPDLDTITKIQNIKKPSANLGGALSSTLAGCVVKTEDQRAIEKCCSEFNNLWDDNEGFKKTIVSMIAIRRLYAVMFRELQDILAGVIRPVGKEIPPELIDFAAQAATTGASKEFNEHQLMEGVTGMLLQHLADVIDKHSEADQKQAIEDRVKHNEERVSRPVPIGFKSTPLDEHTGLNRDRALVLIGWVNAVHWLLNQACEEVLKSNEGQVYTVVRLVTGTVKHEDQHARLIRLPRNIWEGCTNSDRDIDAMVYKSIASRVSAPIDLVVCDDLGLAFTGNLIGRPAPANAGDANRRMMKWCKNMGSALIGALPTLGKMIPDFSGPEFEQLKTFTTLRAVTVQDGDECARPDHYRIVVGNHASVFDVPKDILDAVGAQKLIVPDNTEKLERL